MRWCQRYSELSPMGEDDSHGEDTHTTNIHEISMGRLSQIETKMWDVQEEGEDGVKEIACNDGFKERGRG